MVGGWLGGDVGVSVGWDDGVEASRRKGFCLGGASSDVHVERIAEVLSHTIFALSVKCGQLFMSEIPGHTQQTIHTVNTRGRQLAYPMTPYGPDATRPPAHSARSWRSEEPLPTQRRPAR